MYEAALREHDPHRWHLVHGAGEYDASVLHARDEDPDRDGRGREG